jgi:phosphopantetheinyl transferase
MPYYLNLSVLSNNLNCPQKTERKTRLSAEARRILSQCEGRPLTNEDIAREAGGRPFFPGSDTDFSISHSGNLAAVSLVRGKGLRTGCDVELVRPRAKAKEIAEDFFTIPERDYIESGGSFDLTRFYQIWTLKECFLKLRGLSVFDISSTPSFISREGLYIFDAAGVSPISFNQYELAIAAGERYILTTAIEGTEEQPEIRWFSQDSLDCKSIAKINAALSPAETVSPKI